MAKINFIIDYLSWRAAIDITLISLGLFFIFVTLKRLGTWKILVGIFITIFFYLVARVLDLDAIVWFYGNVSQVAVIGFIILFQPEIRRLFEIALSPRRRIRGQKDDSIERLICEASELLAGQNRGALIVIPGKESVEGFMSGGYSLNADVSIPLILSIFDPNSPGHDGAVILENGKITRFGVRLPISSNERLSSSFGTRHYAAAGLSEVSDALVVAVSEERGTITAFHNGSGQQKTKEELKSTIKTFWQDTERFLPQNKRILGATSWLELTVCFLMASVVWYSVVIGEAEIREKVVTIPIEYIGTPKDLALTGQIASDAKVHLVGPTTNLGNIENLSVRIDLSKTVAGRQKIIITGSNINLGKKVKLVDVQPPSLSLEMVQLVEKELPVKAHFIGKLPGSYKMVSVEIIPAKVKALIRTGRAGDLNRPLLTTPISLDDVKGDTSIVTKIVVPPAIQLAEKRWPEIEVKITVRKK